MTSEKTSLLNSSSVNHSLVNGSLAVSFYGTIGHYSEQLQETIRNLSLPVFDLDGELKHVTAYDYLLLITPSGVSIGKTGKAAPTPVSVDFTRGAVAHRRKYGGGKGQDIAKAVGLNKKNQLLVFDATAGLGRDAFVLATLGCKVRLFERIPFVRALLQSGLEHAYGHDDVGDIVGNMTLADGTLEFHHSQSGEKADVVYLDPMYPHAEKSAAAKKEMTFFRDLIGHDVDADKLLPIALSTAKYRVVVKRPKSAPYLNNEKPTYQINGKSGRFDIYVLKSLEH